MDANPEFAGQDVTLEVEVVLHTPQEALQWATFGMGCFWGPELHFARVPGVMATAVGYSNGSVPNPTYEAVCTGATGHAEVVQLAFDPAVVSYDALLSVFWTRHNPTQAGGQGNDIGTQVLLAASHTRRTRAHALTRALHLPTYAVSQRHLRAR